MYQNRYKTLAILTWLRLIDANEISNCKEVRSVLDQAYKIKLRYKFDCFKCVILANLLAKHCINGHGILSNFCSKLSCYSVLLRIINLRQFLKKFKHGKGQTVHSFYGGDKISNIKITQTKKLFDKDINLGYMALLQK